MLKGFATKTSYGGRSVVLYEFRSSLSLKDSKRSSESERSGVDIKATNNKILVHIVRLRSTSISTSESLRYILTVFLLLDFINNFRSLSVPHRRSITRCKMCFKHFIFRFPPNVNHRKISLRIIHLILMM